MKAEAGQAGVGTGNDGKDEAAGTVAGAKTKTETEKSKTSPCHAKITQLQIPRHIIQDVGSLKICTRVTTCVWSSDGQSSPFQEQGHPT